MFLVVLFADCLQLLFSAFCSQAVQFSCLQRLLYICRSGVGSGLAGSAPGFIKRGIVQWYLRIAISESHIKTVYRCSMSFPYLSDVINYYFGTSWNIPVGMFGLFVAVAIFVSTAIAKIEVRRFEASGRLPKAKLLSNDLVPARI